jgi:hypothetical protein
MLSTRTLLSLGVPEMSDLNRNRCVSKLNSRVTTVIALANLQGLTVIVGNEDWILNSLGSNIILEGIPVITLAIPMFPWNLPVYASKRCNL